MTEAEMKEKWCPMSMGSGVIFTCYGSKCAIWRWTWSPSQVEEARPNYEEGSPILVPHGECGLARE